jgi:YidC/Oxa1 family membrane protein insertase
MHEQKNIVLAVVISFLVLFGYQYFFEMPRLEALRQAQQQAALTEGPQTPEATFGQQAALPAPAAPLPRAEALQQSPRLQLENGTIAGTVALRGLRFDDLHLLKYRDEPRKDSPTVTLLSPSGSEHPYFIELGWTAAAGVRVPTPDTLWQTSHPRLTPEQPVTLSWNNGAGLVFKVALSLDKNYVLTAAQTVENKTSQPVVVFPYGLISRLADHHKTDRTATGAIGAFNNKLTERTFDDLAEDGPLEESSRGGWAGFSDKYWLTAVAPQQDVEARYRFREFQRDGRAIAQGDYLLAAQTVAPGATHTATTRLFTGAKEVERLDDYATTLNLPLFDRAIDFGALYFLTKPLFYALHYIYLAVGNFGVAIIGLTLLVRVFLYPVANKSYKAMNRLKDLQPQMQEIQKRYGTDRMQMSQEMMKLYQKEKVSPFSGCLPILIQIPVFIALYHVFLVSLEMRHAPFFGWIQDLAAPDPAYLVTAFGFLPWNPPGFIAIGVWPALVGITMWLSQKMNPTPMDKAQQMVLNLMPLIFVFTTAQLPAGLAVYWTFNNIVSIIQQKAIRRFSDGSGAKAAARA